MKKAIFWHRRDLRTFDNAGLYKALKSSEEVYPIFIFDTNILQKLPKNDQRILFIHEAISELNESYKKFGSGLQVHHGDPKELIPKLAQKFQVNAVFTNRDYEPYARERDKSVFDCLKAKQIEFIGAKDHVIFEKDEVMKPDGSPYVVFTPFSKIWKAKLNAFFMKSYPTELYFDRLAGLSDSEIPSIQSLGFKSKRNTNSLLNQLKRN